MDATAVAGCRRDAERLAAVAERLADDEVRAPSLLPGWTVGHVLTHVARNADSHRRMVEGVLAGELVDQYPGGPAQREAEIEQGAARPAAALADDVATSAARLDAAFARLGPDHWAGTVRRWGTQQWPTSDLPFMRWREVALHGTDTGLAPLGVDAWDGGYVEAELRRQVAALGPRLPAGALVEVAVADAGWSTLVMGPPGDPLPFARVAADARPLLAWAVGRAPAGPGWPPLAPWSAAP